MSRAEQHCDGRGGGFYQLPHVVHDSPAYRSASLRAKAVLGLLLRRFNGFNNGRITLSLRETAAELGSQNFGAAADAIGELVARGLIAVATDHPRGSRLAREYRLTFVTTGSRGKDRAAATNEYLSWRDGDAGTLARGKIRREESSTEPPLSDELSSADAKLSDEVSSAEPGKKAGTSLNGAASSDEETSAHIGYHLPRSSPAVVSAAPSAIELRERLRAYLRPDGKKAPPGSQGRLATLAGIRDAELSRFKHGNIDLSDEKRIRLACALPRAAAENGRVDLAKHRRQAGGGR